MHMVQAKDVLALPVVAIVLALIVALIGCFLAGLWGIYLATGLLVDATWLRVMMFVGFVGMLALGGE